jgi:hypothetical protein
LARNLEHSIELVRTRVFRAVFGSTFLSWLGAGLFGLGCVALLLRAALDMDLARAALVFAPLAVVPFLAWRIAQRKSLSRAGAAAWLDVRAGSTGAVVTSFETDDGSWGARVDHALAQTLELPRARLWRPALLALGGATFGTLALLVQIPRTPLGPSIALQAASVARVEEKLATLEEEVTLQPEVAAELHETLNRLKDDDALANPESAFEAADRAAERLEKEAESRAEAAESAREGLAAAAASADANPDAAQKDLDAALKELSKAGLARGLRGALSSELGLSSLEIPAGMKLDGAKVEALSGELATKLGNKLAKLAKAGLLKPGAFKGFGKPGELGEYKDHVCTAECAKKPGGT